MFGLEEFITGLLYIVIFIITILYVFLIQKISGGDIEGKRIIYGSIVLTIFNPIYYYLYNYFEGFISDYYIIVIVINLLITVFIFIGFIGFSFIRGIFYGIFYVIFIIISWIFLILMTGGI